MAELWTAANRVAAILSFEAALALALADAGIAPRKQAEAVAAACAEPIADPDAAWASTWEVGTPLLVILEKLGGRLSGDAEKRWLHHGATSQDAIDTAHMILAARSLTLLDGGISRIARASTALMEAHRHQPEMGRTFLQHARPTTFGMRVAHWLEPLLTGLEEIRAVRSTLPVQLGGPVGDRADYGASGQHVVDHVARRLELQSTPISWHTDRSPVWTLVGSVDRAVRSLAKLAIDVALLTSGDSPELSVRSGGSSSLAGKRNPIDAMRALAAADACRGAVAIIEEGRPHELERGLGSWHAEWFALPLVFQTAAAVCEAVERLLDGLTVDAEAMGALVPTTEIPMEAIDAQIDAIAARFHQIL